MLLSLSSLCVSESLGVCCCHCCLFVCCCHCRCECLNVRVFECLLTVRRFCSFLDGQYCAVSVDAAGSGCKANVVVAAEVAVVASSFVVAVVDGVVVVLWSLVANLQVLMVELY